MSQVAHGNYCAALVRDPGGYPLETKHPLLDDERRGVLVPE